jgi:mRNA-degrading endonuclease YafQ of YafQ-DinJ toxin-antitoxin module
MRELVLTPKFKRAFRKFVRRNARLQKQIEDTLERMQADVFATDLSTHKLSGELHGLWACSCGYDCRIVFSIDVLRNKVKTIGQEGRSWLRD